MHGSLKRRLGADPKVGMVTDAGYHFVVTPGFKFETTIYKAVNNGVGIPENNPNLRDDVQKTSREIFAELQAGEITVSAEQGDLIK